MKFSSLLLPDLFVWPLNCYGKDFESWIPPSPNLDKVTVSFDKLNNTDLFHQMQAAYIDGSRAAVV